MSSRGSDGEHKCYPSEPLPRQKAHQPVLYEGDHVEPPPKDLGCSHRDESVHFHGGEPGGGVGREYVSECRSCSTEKRDEHQITDQRDAQHLCAEDEA